MVISCQVFMVIGVEIFDIPEPFQKPTLRVPLAVISITDACHPLFALPTPSSVTKIPVLCG